MNYDFKQTLLSRCLLSGVLAGMAAVLVNFAFNYIYRVATGYTLAEVLNVVSIIISTILINFIGGILYFVFIRMKKGAMIFTVLMLLIIAFSIFGAFETHRSSDATNQQEFKFLFAGVILIDGLFATFVVPYLVNHQKIYS